MSAMRIAAIALVALGLVVLLAALRALLRGLGGGDEPLQRELASLALRPHQRVELPAGPVVLSAEGPNFTTGFAGLRYRLMDAGGAEITGRPVMFRFRRRGFATTRLELRRFEVPAAGAHVLRIDSAGALPVDPAHRLVFARPVRVLRFVAIVLGLIAGGGGLIAGLVLAVLG